MKNPKENRRTGAEQLMHVFTKNRKTKGQCLGLYALNINYTTTRLNVPLGEIQSLDHAVTILDLYFVVFNTADFMCFRLYAHDTSERYLYAL